MIYLLYIATGYLALTSIVLLRNRVNFTRLLSAEHTDFSGQSPKLSICVPARNEERSIERCILSALAQEYPNFEVIVLDDRSEDATARILAQLSHQYPDRLRVMSGRPKPDDWLGKPWACRQLADTASGDILLFADADTWFEKDMASRVVRTMGRHVIDFLTVWPRQKLGSFWERMIIPLVYYALLSLLPAQYVYRAPRWMPPPLRRLFAPYFAAACGQFMVFKTEAYRAIGGHRAVKDRVVEDVELAKRVKRKGLAMRMYYGGDTVACRMYRSPGEIYRGFRKNFLAGFGHHIPLFGAAGLLHLIVYVLPFFTLAAGVISNATGLILWSALPVALILYHRILLAFWFGWNPIYGLLHPVAVLWFQYLGIRVLWDYYKGEKTSWKGRPV